MIARPSTPLRPIPFSRNPHWPAHTAHPGQVSWSGTVLAAHESPPTPWAQTGQAQISANDAQAPKKAAPKADAAPQAGRTANRSATSTPRPAPQRQAVARYDGPHTLSVRSAASGRHYRFEHRGATLVIDAVDIALMRRIDDITVL